MTKPTICLVLLFWLPPAATAADPKSGLQPGDLATPFNVKDVTGPNRGISLCYR